MQDARTRMEQLTHGLKTVSDKIRALDRAGYARAEIARFLDKRYQHVRNVLEQDKTVRSREPRSRPETLTAKTRIGADGRVVIPAAFRDAVGVKDGDTLFVRLKDGEIRLSSAATTTQRVRALLRKFIPPGTPLVDELIAERRREAKREGGGE